MTIENQFGLTAFNFRPDTAIEGMPIEGLDIIARPVANPLRREIWTLTAGGSATAGDYTALITGADGFELEHTFTRVGETNDQIAAEWAEGLLALAARKGVILSAEVTSNAIAIRFKHAGRSYTVLGTPPSPATFAAVETLSQEGVELVCGRFVVHATLEGLASVSPPGNSAAKTDIAGVMLRPHATIGRPRGEITTPPGHAAGRMVAPATQCIFAARNVGSVAAAPGGQVFVVVNTAGSQLRGQARADDDGSNAISLDLTQARWLTPTPVNGLGALQVTL
jgi:hypothetical protein